ncbi:hypothetical protein DB346_20725 [Verrucomicrobia bacterium LW23]|nr:hypothetical protein DB346_20725 [Verrucomicrobia bacterium LW23]
MRVPYMIGGWLFVVFSLLVLFLRIVDPEPDKAGRTLLVIATTIFAGYLLYTANTEIRQVDSRHSGIQFWISLGAACGFVSLALCVAWVLARFITA